MDEVSLTEEELSEYLSNQKRGIYNDEWFLESTKASEMVEREKKLKIRIAAEILRLSRKNVLWKSYEFS